jgi:archaellum component FlaC
MVKSSPSKLSILKEDLHRKVIIDVQGLERQLKKLKKDKKDIANDIKDEFEARGFFSNSANKGRIDEIENAMQLTINTATKDVDIEIEKVKKTIEKKLAFSGKLDEEYKSIPTSKKSRSLFDFLNVEQEPVRASTASLNKSSNKILRSTSNSIKDTRLMSSPTSPASKNRSRFAK